MELEKGGSSCHCIDLNKQASNRLPSGKMNIRPMYEPNNEYGELGVAMGQMPVVAGYVSAVGYVPVEPTWHHKKCKVQM
jgi:hypothetical protein